MNATFERLFDPYPTAAEAVQSWERLHAEQGPPKPLERPASRSVAILVGGGPAPGISGVLASRLVVSMILREDIRRAVEAAAGPTAPTAGFLVPMSRLADRMRVTPLLYLADADPEVARFLVEHPHAVEALLEEEGDGPPEDPWAFAARLPDGPHEFLQGVRWVAPLLLEGCGIDRRRAEAFLHYVHAPAVFGPLSERLLAGRDVRSELTTVAAEFRRTLAPAAVAPQGKPVEVNLTELIVRRVGEAVRLVKCVGAAMPALSVVGVRTRGAVPAPQDVMFRIQEGEATVVVTVRPAAPEEFEVTLAISGQRTRGTARDWEVHWSDEGVLEQSLLGAEGGTASVRLRAGRYHFACVSPGGAEGPRFRLVLENAG